MALVWADSFDHQGSNSFLEPSGYFSRNLGGANFTGITTTTPRTGPNCIQFDSVNSFGAGLGRIIANPFSTGGAGCGIMILSQPPLVAPKNGIMFGVNGITHLLRVCVNPSFGLQVQN